MIDASQLPAEMATLPLPMARVSVEPPLSASVVERFKLPETEVL